MDMLSLDALMGHLVSFVSYRVVSVCLLSVPVTHFMGLYLRFPKTSQHWKYWLFPFKGGNRHIVLQLMSWVSFRTPFGFACMSCLLLQSQAVFRAAQQPRPAADVSNLRLSSSTRHLGFSAVLPLRPPRVVLRSYVPK